jgi:hypothetical protein
MAVMALFYAHFDVAIYLRMPNALNGQPFPYLHGNINPMRPVR